MPTAYELLALRQIDGGGGNGDGAAEEEDAGAKEVAYFALAVFTHITQSGGGVGGSRPLPPRHACNCGCACRSEQLSLPCRPRSPQQLPLPCRPAPQVPHHKHRALVIMGANSSFSWTAIARGKSVVVRRLAGLVARVALRHKRKVELLGKLPQKGRGRVLVVWKQ